MDLAKEGLVSTTVEKGKYTATFPAGQDDNTLTTNVIYELKDNALYYTVEVQNNLDTGLIIGDIAIPFPMNSSFQWGKKPTESVLRHHQISGHNSFIFWMRCNSVGPYLMLTPTGDAKFEYFDRYRGRGPEPTDDQERRRQWRRRHRHFSAYIHSEARGEIAAEKGCNWRQEHTSVTLAPKGAAGDSIAYTFKFQWVNDYEHIRNVLVEEGFIDVQVIPGMTVPSDLYAKFYLKTKQDIKSVVPEFPEETELEYLGEKVENTHIYKVKFNRLGENKLTISYGDGKTTILEFFSTEPVETLINKRGAFIAKRQHRDPSKWYNGLLAEWNNETEVLLGPDNYDNIKGWRIYEVTCDDPGLSKPAFLAAKNAEYPVQEEIEALDYYIENFVWGGLQMTEEEEYPYGIYGIPDWYQNRNSEDDGPGGKTHIWRIYDYPHIIQMYWGMYRVAKNHPEYKTYLERDEYLKRAYRTALALFLIPAEVTGWIAYRTGLYNELVIVDIIDELYKRGWKMQAQRLERHWQKKVQHFVGEESDLFGSEYPFDSTGFESTHALAKYALKNAKKNIEIDPEKRKKTPRYYL